MHAVKDSSVYLIKRGMLSVNMADFQMARNTSIMQMDRNNGFDENERRGSPAL